MSWNGPGLITVITEEKVYHPVAEQLQSAMVHTISPQLELPRTCSAVLIGPGLAAKELSPTIPEVTRRLWQESPLGIIVDASALEWLPPGPCPDKAFRLITPHPGEAARMLDTSPGEIQGNRGQAVRELSNDDARRLETEWNGVFIKLGVAQGQLKSRRKAFAEVTPFKAFMSRRLGRPAVA